jgi:fibronectin-binding autotransporter adhesin
MPFRQRKIKSRKLATPTAAVTVVTAALLLLAVLGGTQANAANITWGNVGSDFATGANWLGGTAPADNITADIGVFTDATAAANPAFTANRSINGLQFDSGTAAWTFTGSGGTQTLTLGSGGITNSSANTQTFSASGLQLALGTNSTIAGPLFIGSAVNLSNHTLTLSGSAPSSTILGVVSGTGGLVKQGSGTVFLAANTYTGGTTINEGGLFIYSDTAFGTGDVTFNGGTVRNYSSDIQITNNYVLNGVGTLENSSGGLWTNSGVISGAGSLILRCRQGGELMILSATNTYTGGTTVYGTVVEINHGSSFGSGTVTWEMGPDGNILNELYATDSLQVTNNFVLNTELYLGSYGAVWTNSGAISGAGDLIANANFLATLVLSGSNNFTGQTRIANGVLSLDNPDALSGSTLDHNYGGSLSFLTVTNANLGGLQGINNLALTNDSGGNVALSVGGNNQSTSYDGILSGGGSLTKAGTGTMILTDVNTYTGTTTINGGVLAVTNGAAIPDTGTVILANSNGATLTVEGSETIGSLRGGGATGGNVSIASGQTLTVAETGSQTFAGAITNAGGLSKTGTGTLTLSGSNSLTGGTVVSNGTLRMAATGTLDGVTTVTNAGTIAGTGTVGTLNINGGGVLAPGNSAGTLTATNGATWSQGGSYNWEIFDLANNPGTSWDLLDVTAGTLDLTGITTAGGFTINLITLLGDNTTPGALTGFNPTANYTNIWLIAQATNITGFNAANFNLVSGNFVGATGTFTITQLPVGGGQGLYLNYNGDGAVPEPGTWAMAALLLSGAAATIYRRRKAAKQVSAAD